MPTSNLLSTLTTHGWLEDARYALRTVRRDLGFFAFAAIIMGLAIGATTAVYSVMAPLVLRPLDFEEPDRLVWIANDSGDGLSGQTSRVSNLRDFREMSRSLESIAAFNAFFEYNSYNLTGDGLPERLVGVDVTTDFFDVLGVSLAYGRGFREEEAVDWDVLPSIILTHGYWTRRFGADPNVLGRTITLNDAPVEVVGILPASFDFASTFSPGSQVDFLRPWPVTDQTNNWGNTVFMIGRLVPDASPQAAQAELDQIVSRLKAEQPDRWGLAAVVTGLQEKVSGPIQSALWLLAAGAFSVLLIACANLSNLLLARGPKRRKEMAVRSAMGANRGRLTRQLLMESLVLSLAGAVLGVVIAKVATDAVAASSAFRIPLLASVSVDASAMLFTLGVATVAGVLVGLVPALQASHGTEARVIREDSRSGLESRRSTRVREALVIAEIAVACVLLVGGGLLLRSFTQILDVDLGYQPENAVSWRVSPARTFDSIAPAVAYFDAMADRVAAIPGVEGVGLTDTSPLGRNRSWGIGAHGVSYEEGQGFDAYPRLVDHRYIESMEIPLRAGRGFTPDDRDGTAFVGLLNQEGADALFPGQDPIGQFVVTGGPDPIEIVGVVGNVKHLALEAGSGIEVYLPARQRWYSGMEMVVRSTLPTADLVASVQAALAEVDPALPTDDFASLQSVVDQAVSPRRFILTLLGAFAGTALLLAALGIYGVLSYSVSQRIPEIGVRMALGESASQVQRRVVGRTLALSLTGVVLGAILAGGATRMIASLLYGVAPTDILTFVAVAMLLLGVAGLAGYLPARRAARADPARAFRGA